MLGGGQPCDGHAERDERRQEHPPVGLRAARDDPGAAAEQAQRAGGVVRRAADARAAAVDHVAREVADHRHAAHGGQC